MIDDDRDLKDEFQQWRSDAAARTPSFERVMARRRPARRRSWVPVLAVGAAAAVLVSVLVSRSRSHPVAAPFTIAVGELRMPTDFLLEVQSVPSVARSDDWFSNLAGVKGNPL